MTISPSGSSSSMPSMEGSSLYGKLISSADQQKGGSVVKNLSAYSYPERESINTQIKTLSEEAGENEYLLGMVLLASAQQGDKDPYESVLARMQGSLAKLSKEDDNLSYKTWRLGRMLLAADSYGDKATENKVLTELKDILGNSKTKQDCFSAWAWGYLANYNKTEYEHAKKQMISSALALTETYQKTKQSLFADKTEMESKLNAEESNLLQSDLSNALWAWVLNFQAAANANDEEMYNYIRDQMKSITGQSTVGDALSKGLLRAAASNDYPAWALGIAQLAAATMKDKELFLELKKPLADSIKGAKEASKLAEATLAQLAAALATIRIA